MSRALALALLLVASSARAEASRRHLDRASADPLTKPAHHHSAKRQTDSADDLAPYTEDDGTDLVALVAALNDEDDRAPIAKPDSASVGSPNAGSLHGAVQLPPHPGYVVRDPSRAWGTANTIARLTSAFAEVVGADPVAPRVRVHDLSLQNGGPMRGHKSHQTGRDVDITYYQRNCDRECPAVRVTATDLDAVRQWHLLRHWLERGDAEFIFIDYALQRPLYEQAKSAGASSRQLALWFQYPRGPALPVGVIRHAPNHANHVHVRFRCAPRDGACRQAATRQVLMRDATAAPSLLELVNDESGDDALLNQLQD